MFRVNKMPDRLTFDEISKRLSEKGLTGE